MRRYRLLITLFLSVLLPLHVAANTLFAATNGPVASNMSHSSNMEMSNGCEGMHMPDCCDEKDTAGCQQMQSCFGCPLFSLASPLLTFNFTSPARIYSRATAMPFVAAFDPASVWRPPTHS